MGEVLVLYPEGERKDGPIVQPLFDGAAYVAAKAGVPIVPVGIGGSDRVMPQGARFVFPRKVHVVIGPPIPAPIGAGERLPRAVLKEHSDRLHAELQRLYDEAQRRVGRVRARRTPRRSRRRAPTPATPDRGRRTARGRSASTAAARRRRRWRSRAGSR